MQDSIIKEALEWGAKIIFYLGGALVALYMLVWKGDRKRLDSLEEKVPQFVTKPEVDEIVAEIKKEFKSDHHSLDAKIDRIEQNLRSEIRNSHDSLQNGIDKVVNILLTRDENDRRRRE